MQFRKIQKIQPAIFAKVDINNYGSLGLTLFEMKKFEEALKYFDLAIEKNQDNSAYCFNKGKKNKLCILSAYIS